MSFSSFWFGPNFCQIWFYFGMSLEGTYCQGRLRQVDDLVFLLLCCFQLALQWEEFSKQSKSSIFRLLRTRSARGSIVSSSESDSDASGEFGRRFVRTLFARLREIEPEPDADPSSCRVSETCMILDYEIRPTLAPRARFARPLTGNILAAVNRYSRVMCSGPSSLRFRTEWVCSSSSEFSLSTSPRNRRISSRTKPDHSGFKENS